MINLDGFLPRYRSCTALHSPRMRKKSASVPNPNRHTFLLLSIGDFGKTDNCLTVTTESCSAGMIVVQQTAKKQLGVTP